MATSKPVREGSSFCRDCGGPITTVMKQSVCLNKQPKVHCANLTAQNRLCCEHCGSSVRGAMNCTNPSCGKPPHFP
jgi:hypothetical protein